ncbi:hypothetical protein PsYK624_084420 [Phanerochaete sordida]|uniref:Uncharacterized protein n=1 Tax=Phanerochaete sordida TaxID=48140 RepID=A0A9P3GCD1_9APHY|nr:hypothetical protein PsYK624_084420 [Phanerochaete sordida]
MNVASEAHLRRVRPEISASIVCSREASAHQWQQPRCIAVRISWWRCHARCPTMVQRAALEPDVWWAMAIDARQVFPGVSCALRTDYAARSWDRWHQAERALSPCRSSSIYLVRANLPSPPETRDRQSEARAACQRPKNQCARALRLGGASR